MLALECSCCQAGFFLLKMSVGRLFTSQKKFFSHFKKLECNTCNFCCIHNMLASWPISQSLAGRGGGLGSGVGEESVKLKKVYLTTSLT